MTGTTNDWAQLLHDFTNRNAGRPTLLEVDDPELGAQEEEREYLLRGVTYDHRADEVEIMLGELGSTDRHLTHTVARPRRIELLADDQGRDQVLWIDAQDTRTRLNLLAP